MKKQAWKMDIKDTKYWNIFADVFNLMKQGIPVQDTDTYWKSVISSADEIYKKYMDTKESQFVLDLILDILNELENIIKC